jgi:hypothetical protein
MNRQTTVLVAVGAVAAFAAILVLLPSEGPVTVPKETVEGTATVAPNGAAFEVADGAASPDQGGGAEADGKPKITSRFIGTPNPDRPDPMAGLVPQPGLPLDRHGQQDSHLWLGIYRMLVQEQGETDLARRAHEMGTTVAGVTAANDVAAYAPLFAEERALVAEVRGATTNAQVLDNCDRLEAAMTAIEAGRLHPVDKQFETTADAATPD